MFVVGVTGGIGSGKTAVTDEFKKHGINVVDSDVISRKVVEPGTPGLLALVNRYGQHILQPDLCLNRSALRTIIFDSQDERKWVESLLHPLIRQQTLADVSSSTSSYTLLSSPLLIESGQLSLVNRVLVVDVPEDIQVVRASLRDGVTKKNIRDIIQSQISREKRMAMADDILDNSGSIESILPAVAGLHQKYLEMAEPYVR